MEFFTSFLHILLVFLLHIPLYEWHEAMFFCIIFLFWAFFLCDGEASFRLPFPSFLFLYLALSVWMEKIWISFSSFFVSLLALLVYLSVNDSMQRFHSMFLCFHPSSFSSLSFSCLTGEQRFFLLYYPSFLLSILLAPLLWSSSIFPVFLQLFQYYLAGYVHPSHLQNFSFIHNRKILITGLPFSIILPFHTVYVMYTSF